MSTRTASCNCGKLSLTYEGPDPSDPTFPPPVISGFEAYGRAWVMNISDLPMPNHHHDGTSSRRATSVTTWSIMTSGGRARSASPAGIV